MELSNRLYWKSYDLDYEEESES